MQQGLLMDCVLHLWDLLQIRHLEAFSLEVWTQDTISFKASLLHVFLFKLDYEMITEQLRHHGDQQE